MRVQVGFENAAGDEVPSAQVAAERLLARVGTNVLLQVTRFLKALIAHDAPDRTGNTIIHNITHLSISLVTD